MPTSEQVKHDDSSCPNVSFLRISEDISHLFGWLVQEGAALGEVSYCIEAVLNSKTEIKKLDLSEIFGTAEDYVIGFDITMDHILRFVQVCQRAEKSTHNLCALLLGKTSLSSFCLVFLKVGRNGLFSELHLHYYEVLILFMHLINFFVIWVQ